MKWLLLLYVIGSRELVLKGDLYDTEFDCRTLGRQRLVDYQQVHWNRMAYLVCEPVNLW